MRVTFPTLPGLTDVWATRNLSRLTIKEAQYPNRTSLGAILPLAPRGAARQRE
jgi:hypothetical protein